MRDDIFWDDAMWLMSELPFRMKEAIRSSETPVLTRGTWRHIPEEHSWYKKS
jgi:hypothetical protein